MQTHQVGVDAARRLVTKRFVQRDRGEPAREWRALTLLAGYAPGLAPEPVGAELAADPPVIRMSWLPGDPLCGRPLTPAAAEALGVAIRRLWASVPVSEVRLVPGETGKQAQVVTAVTGLAGLPFDAGGDVLLRRAHAAGLEWLSSAIAAGGPFGDSRSATDGTDPGLVPVFGQGDSNLANFLWDGDQLRLVDFEDSGPSDRALELADLVEHLSAWLEAGLDAEAFIATFGLPAPEQSRLLECRRLAAVHWLLILRPGGRANARNPPVTLHRQAARLLALLDQPPSPGRTAVT